MRPVQGRRSWSIGDAPTNRRSGRRWPSPWERWRWSAARCRSPHRWRCWLRRRARCGRLGIRRGGVRRPLATVRITHWPDGYVTDDLLFVRDGGPRSTRPGRSRTITIKCQSKSRVASVALEGGRTLNAGVKLEHAVGKMQRQQQNRYGVTVGGSSDDSRHHLC